MNCFGKRVEAWKVLEKVGICLLQKFQQDLVTVRTSSIVSVKLVELLRLFY